MLSQYVKDDVELKKGETMNYILDAKEAKLLDQISIENMHIPSIVLMERASLRVAECVEAYYSKDKKILVLAGVGNNGGDGFACGRILEERGYFVHYLMLGNEEKATTEVKTQLSILRALNAVFVTEPEDTYDVIIDALFGIGLSREIQGKFYDMIAWANKSKADIVAVDVPSGVDASDGKIHGVAIQARHTVTFGTDKIGLEVFPGHAYAGEIHVVSMGFPRQALEQVAPKAFTYDYDDFLRLRPKRKSNTHKGSYGKLLVIAGSKEIAGAALFAAKAAYRMGVGLVHVVTHENNRTLFQSQLPEALMSYYTDRYDLSKEIQWADGLIIGPGIGTDDIAKDLLKQVYRIKDKPIVIDADGINLLAGWEDVHHDNCLDLGENVVLTPHIKELSRLLHGSVEDVGKYGIGELAQKMGKATLVKKDARTWVSDGRQHYLNLSGNNALAKGGSGDVLAGIIGGLLVLGVPTMQAASLGVYLHGLLADEYVKERSSSSLLATELLDMIPYVLAKH